MARISVLHTGNKSSILLVPTIIVILVLLWLTPKYLNRKSVKSKECTHDTITEFGICEDCQTLLAL